MQVRWIAPSFLVALSGSALAQSHSILGKNDAAFARELYRRGYADLAEKLCDVMEKSGKLSGDEAVVIKALHLDLRLDIAKNEPDLYQRKDLIKLILQEKEMMVRDYRGSKEAVETSNTLPEVYRQLGDAIGLAIQKEKNAQLIGELQDEGQKIYSQAEDAIKSRIEALKNNHIDPVSENAYVSALYNLPRTYYFHSLLIPKGGLGKSLLLEKAITGFQEFGLDYSNLILNYEGMIMMGLCDKDLENFDNALGAFEDTIKQLRESYDPDSKGVFPLTPEESDTLSRAVLQKMLLLYDLKRHEDALAISKKFFETTPDPLETASGLAVLAQQAETQIAQGDLKGANDSANKLVDFDGNGIWGAKGREIQAQLLQGPGSSKIGAVDTLKIAASLANKGQGERALQICQQAIAAAHGTSNEAAIGVDAYLLIGSIYLQRPGSWSPEAAVAFDAAADRYPNAEKAPEAVYQSLQQYIILNREEKKSLYKTRIGERMKTLTTRYPNHPRAAYAQIAEGQQLEGENEFLKAAACYQKVTPGAASFLEAQFRTGNAYFLQARKLFGDKKPDEAKQYVTQAETLLKKSIEDLDTATKGTMDLEAQGRFDRLGFGARLALAQMYLNENVNRAPDVVTLLTGADEKYAADPDKVSTIWGLTISALEKQGKVDEAVTRLEALLRKDPESRAIGGAAGQVARALDKRADDLSKQKKVKEASDIWKKAATYYSLSGRGMLKSSNVRADDLVPIAERLFVLGLDFNGVPESQSSFVGWSPGKNPDTNLWKQAGELYAAALKVSPSYRTMISLGRAQGFLGKWAESAAVYGQLFDQEVLFDKDTKKINNVLNRSKPELLQAYLEWGVAENGAAQAESDQDRYDRATTVFDNLTKTLQDPSSSLWWQAKYYQIKNLVDAGKWEPAAVQMRDLERTTQSLGGGDAALKDLFTALKAEIAKKTFPQPPKQQQKTK